ncbi:hypothetical protein Tco_0504008, partial [Tanacetum coccineum]
AAAVRAAAAVATPMTAVAVE